MVEYTRFRRFLTERGCAREFEEAFGNQHPGYKLDAALWDILGGDEFFLARAFDWTMTKEGREYWKAIDNKWYNHIMGI